MMWLAARSSRGGTDANGGGVRRGPLAMIGASFAFTCMVAFVKVAREELPALDVVFWRAAIATPLLLPAMRGANLRLAFKGAFTLRLLFGVSAMICFFTAAKGLPLVDLNLITRLQPVLVALIAPLVLGAGERADRGVWISTLAGFGGCAMILAPSLAIGSLYGLIALGATVFSTGAHLSLRKLAAHDGMRAIVLWFHVGLVILSGGALIASGRGITPPPSSTWPALVGVGVFATAGQLLLTRAYKADRAPIVAAASYSGILWAVVLDVVFFESVPGADVLLGGLLVVASGVYLVVKGRTGRGTPGPT